MMVESEIVGQIDANLQHATHKQNNTVKPVTAQGKQQILSLWPSDLSRPGLQHFLDGNKSNTKTSLTVFDYKIVALQNIW